MTGHEMARKLLELPDVDVTMYHSYSGNFFNVESIRYGIEQDHQTGEPVKDAEGKDEKLIRIE